METKGINILPLRLLRFIISQQKYNTGHLPPF